LTRAIRSNCRASPFSEKYFWNPSNVEARLPFLP
jgi:hypothetical protein